MNSNDPGKDAESIGQAAARLLRRLEERASGKTVVVTARIQYPASPLPEKGPVTAQMGVVALVTGQFAVPSGEEVGLHGRSAAADGGIEGRRLTAGTMGMEPGSVLRSGAASRLAPEYAPAGRSREGYTLRRWE